MAAATAAAAAAAAERLRIEDFVGFKGVDSWGSGVLQAGKYSTLGLWGVVRSAVVEGFLSVPVVWGSESDGRRGQTATRGG